MTTLQLAGVSRIAGSRTLLHNISLTFAEGKVNLLLGPNGAGKTTLMRVCATLNEPDEGELRVLPGENAQPHPARDGITMVFQHTVRFNRSVWANVAYPLRVRGLPRHEIELRVAETLRVADLEHLSSRRAPSLSGGEAQRLALARAYVIRPTVLLLDEPAANLDPASRWRVEDMVLQMRDRFGTTVVLTTHDLFHARKVGDTVFFINRGRVFGEYKTRDFFHNPPSEEAARFITGILHRVTE